MNTSIVALDSVEVCLDLEFKPFKLEDISSLYEFLNRYPHRSCDYSIGGIYLWIDLFKYRYAMVDDTLFIMGYDRDVPFFYRPIGALPEEESYEMIYSYCREHDIFPRILADEFVDAETQVDELPKSRYKREWMEYVYPIDKFIGFPGKKMEKKRNHLNYFLNHYQDFKIVPLSEKYFDQVSNFTAGFEAEHDASDSLIYESDEALLAIKDFSKYPFIGFAIKIGDKIEGYTYGEVVGDTLFAHVEKGNYEIRGIYQALASFLCKYAKNKYPELKYVNREDDAGSEHLRQSKMSYHPCGYVLKRWE